MCFQINTIGFNDGRMFIVSRGSKLFRKTQKVVSCRIFCLIFYLDFPRRTNIKVAYIRYIDKCFRYGTLTVS